MLSLRRTGLSSPTLSSSRLTPYRRSACARANSLGARRAGDCALLGLLWRRPYIPKRRHCRNRRRIVGTHGNPCIDRTGIGRAGSVMDQDRVEHCLDAAEHCEQRATSTRDPIAQATFFVAAISAEAHREWSCYPEATPYEFLSAVEIEARGRHKKKTQA